jgi:hypothetical protein
MNIGGASAMAPDAGVNGYLPVMQNPALTDLAPLVGRWSLEAVFPASRDQPVRGEVAFDWTENAAFLAMRSTMEAGGPPNGVAVIGRDEAGPDYRMLYFDERGVSRVYAMSFGADGWRLWRGAPGFWQRFHGVFGEDGAQIKGAWEKSPDGAAWEHDFAVTYRR